MQFIVKYFCEQLKQCKKLQDNNMKRTKEIIVCHHGKA